MVSHLRLKYWIASRPFLILANTLLKRKKSCKGLFFNPPFLQILLGDSNFLSPFQILPYILNLAISQITNFEPTPEAPLPP